MGLLQRIGAYFNNDREAARPLRRDPRVAVRVLMVCLGNLCRSPTAEAVLAHYTVQAGLVATSGLAASYASSYHLGALLTLGGVVAAWFVPKRTA